MCGGVAGKGTEYVEDGTVELRSGKDGETFSGAYVPYGKISRPCG